MSGRPSPVEAWAAAKTAGRRPASVYLGLPRSSSVYLGLPRSTPATGIRSPQHTLRCTLQRQTMGGSAPTAQFVEDAASLGIRPSSRPAVYPTAMLRQIQRRGIRRRQALLLAKRKQAARAISVEEEAAETKKYDKTKVTMTSLYGDVKTTSIRGGERKSETELFTKSF